MLWSKLILLEGIASVPTLLFASVYFMMIKYRHGERARLVYACMCSLCPMVLTVARQLISLGKIQLQRHIQCVTVCRWLGTRTISGVLTLWYFMCTVALCMIDKSFEAVCYVLLFSVNLLIAFESHLCLPRQWLAEQETQAQVQGQLQVQSQVQSQVVKTFEKYTASMGCTTCLICLDEFEEDISTVARLPCDHVFHSDCAERWLRQNNRCPLRCTDKSANEQPDQHAPTRTDDEQLELELHARDGVTRV